MWCQEPMLTVRVQELTSSKTPWCHKPVITTGTQEHITGAYLKGVVELVSCALCEMPGGWEQGCWSGDSSASRS